MNKTKFLFASAAAAVAILIGSSNSNAQTNAPASDGDSKATRLGIGLNAGIPTTDGYKFAFGGDLRLQKDFTSNVSGLLSVGYNTFSVDSEIYSAVTPAGEIVDNLDYIPVKVGLKVFPVQRFYFSGEVGAAFPMRDGAKTAFVYAPGIGVGTNLGIDVGLRYEGMTGSANLLSLKNPGQVALRLAYGFSL
ncbi:MAG: hypothetical protein ACO1NS_11865 [Daejeonella sp.]|uniref:hypothetical protein n=1 Tax=Daejeonella sp. JGW-45 TaxID=3034148 RepID=UPI0023EDC7FD|nr:hypothetical protein [Daejeonella sp. JGW-45]